METEHIYQGNSIGEWLIISQMDNANPSHELRNWVEAILYVTGFPLVNIVQASDPAPKLLEWQYVDSPASLTQKLEVDEVHLYEGMTQLSSSSPVLSRIYMLLARRINVAWKICLAFNTACIPGTPQVMINTNDHARAAATLGRLRFLK